MDLSIDRRGELAVIDLDGRLDRSSVKALRDLVAELIGEGVRNLVVDLTRTDDIDSAGLRVLMTVAKRLEVMGGSLILCGLQPEVRKSFNVAGLAARFTITPQRDEAITRLVDSDGIAAIADLAADLLAQAENR